MSFRFEKLKVWQDARAFCVQVYKVTSKFPSRECFALTDQIRRAVISVILNIVEGSSRSSDKEFVRFLRISIGSLHEVVAGTYIALDLKYLNSDDFEELYSTSNTLASKINALINSIKKQ